MDRRRCAGGPPDLGKPGAVFSYFIHRLRERAVHFAWNLLLGAINPVVIALLFVTARNWTAQVSADRQFGLLHWLEGLPAWAGAAIAILGFDFWTYTGGIG